MPILSKNMWKKKQNIAIVLGIAVLLLLTAAGITAAYFCGGKNQMLERVCRVNERSIYQTQGAAFPENRVNILLLGIDKEEEMSQPDDDGGSLGQADAIFVVSLDLESSRVKILSIPRDTMVEVWIYDELGQFCGRQKTQLCLQYAYGDGQAFSCELMQKQVAELLGVPLHGYAALNLEMIPILNDIVGGVDLIMDEDYTFINQAFEKGAVLHLTGEEARTELQENPLLILSRLQTLPDYIETDLEVNEMVSLIQAGKECPFEETDFRVLEG